jgi:RNA polymerase sigma factor (sigma-70 family)
MGESQLLMQSDTISDSDIVKAILEGGPGQDRAIDVLYRRYRVPVIKSTESYLKYRTGARDAAVDSVQDAFILMVEKIREGGYKDGSLIHFWIGITKGLLRNKLKRDARMDLTGESGKLDQVDVATPEHLLMTAERNAVVDTLLSKLGDRCKQVLLLWAGGYSMEEIAHETGLSSEGMARKVKFQCKNALMKLIGEQQPEYF